MPFLSSHIYFPVGVVTMLLLAAGFGLLMWAKVRRQNLRVPEAQAGLEQTP